MYPGTALEIEDKTEGILLKVPERGPSLIEKQGILVHHGSGTVSLDTAELINRERERRNKIVLKASTLK